MTVRLYYENSNIIEFSSNVEEIVQKDNEYHIILRETAFYPGGGGQPSDVGIIDGVKVERVYESNNKIYHVTKSPINKEFIHGSVDFNRRFDYMQQHSGEHLLATAIYKLFNGHNIGFHLGEDYTTIDVSLPEINNEMLELIENFANDIIYKNLKIKSYMVDDIQIKSIPLRKKTNIKEKIRVVEIKGIDYSACCGTHLDSTGQIGIIKILKTEKYKGNTRVYFKCGNRAFADYCKKHKIIIELTKLLSSEDLDIYKRVDLQSNLIREQQKNIVELKHKIIEYEVNNIFENIQGKIFKRVYYDKSFEDINDIAKMLTKKDISVLVCSTLENMIVVSSPKVGGIDCCALIKEHIKEYGGKGGGNKNRVQINFPTSDAVIKFYNHIKTLI